MALSGSVTSSPYISITATDGSGVSGTAALQCTWTATQSIANNTSTISYTIKTVGTFPTYGDYSYWGGTVSINGKTVYNDTTSSYIMVKTGQVLATGTTTIAHNTDGSKSFSITVKAAIFMSTSYNSTKTQSFTLNSIPRAATFTSSANFTDEGNPTIGYSNPAGNAVSNLIGGIQVNGTNIVSKSLSKTGSSYTFNLTDSVRQTLRNLTPNSNTLSVRFFLKTTINETVYTKYSDKSMTIVNANPTIAPTVVDTNSTTIALTGDSNKLVKGVSNAKFTFNATAYKGASISSYVLTNGGATSTTATGTRNGVTNGTFTFKAFDSRQNNVTSTVTKTVINYVKPIINVSSSELTTAGKYTATVTGTVFRGSFGAVTNVPKLYSRMKTSGGTWSSWEELLTPTSNNFTYNYSRTGLDYRAQYTIQFKIVDSINSVYTDQINIKSIPLFDWDNNDFNFHIPVKIDGVELIDIFYPVGAIFISTKNTNPHSTIGGTWQSKSLGLSGVYSWQRTG